MVVGLCFFCAKHIKLGSAWCFVFVCAQCGVKSAWSMWVCGECGVSAVDRDGKEKEKTVEWQGRLRWMNEMTFFLVPGLWLSFVTLTNPLVSS